VPRLDKRGTEESVKGVTGRELEGKSKYRKEGCLFLDEEELKISSSRRRKRKTAERIADNQKPQPQRDGQRNPGELWEGSAGNRKKERFNHTRGERRLKKAPPTTRSWRREIKDSGSNMEAHPSLPIGKYKQTKTRLSGERI